MMHGANMNIVLVVHLCPFLSRDITGFSDELSNLRLSCLFAVCCGY